MGQHVLPQPRLQRVLRPAIVQEENEIAAYRDQKQRVPVDPVTQPLPPRRGAVFGQRHRVHLARVAVVEVGDIVVMHIVIVLHRPVGRQCHQRQPIARQVVGPFGREQRIVPAVVLKNIKADPGHTRQNPKRHRGPYCGPCQRGSDQRGEEHRVGPEIAERGQTVVFPAILAGKGADFPRHRAFCPLLLRFWVWGRVGRSPACAPG